MRRLIMTRTHLQCPLYQVGKQSEGMSIIERGGTNIPTSSTLKITCINQVKPRVGSRSHRPTMIATTGKLLLPLTIGLDVNRQQLG